MRKKKPIKFYLDELKDLQERMRMVGNKYKGQAFRDMLKDILQSNQSNPFNV